MSDSNNGIRIDKFLWAVRIFKTRGLAADACQMGRILLNGSVLKPSRIISCNDLISVRKPPVTFTFRILKEVANRQPAKLVPLFIEDLTPESEKSKLEMRQAMPVGFRKKGTGRPTKKERRIIDKWSDDLIDS